VNLARDHLSLQEIEWLAEGTWHGSRQTKKKPGFHLAGVRVLVKAYCKCMKNFHEGLSN